MIVLNNVLKLIQRIQPAMANVVKISLGSLGCLGGGKGNLRETSLHDSTCQCEGCVEKRLAAQEFSLTTENQLGERDYGFNAGDEGGPDAPGEIIVLTDDDDDGRGSVSDIFDMYNDEPSDDAGYCDDGEDSEDAYSVFSPKPCSSDEEWDSEDDIELEDTPFENRITDASIEASKRDEQIINNCAETVEEHGHSTVQQKELDTFMNTYDSKMMSLFKQVSKYADGIRAAKRRLDYDTAEIQRLRDLCMDKTAEVNRKDKELYKMAKEMGRLALKHDQILDHQRETIQRLKQHLADERKKTQTLEEELHFTRKRLLTHTRRSVPRKCKRVRRHIDFDNESENEEQTNIALTAAMTNLNTATV